MTSAAAAGLAQNEYLGDGESGSLTQSGGTNAAGNLNLGSSGSASYNLNGGLLILSTLGITQDSGAPHSTSAALCRCQRPWSSVAADLDRLRRQQHHGHHGRRYQPLRQLERRRRLDESRRGHVGSQRHEHLCRRHDRRRRQSGNRHGSFAARRVELDRRQRRGVCSGDPKCFSGLASSRANTLAALPGRAKQ